MATTETRRIQFEFTARDRGVQRTTQETGDSIEHMNDGLEGGTGKMGKLGAIAGKLGPVLAGVSAAAALIGPAIAKGLDAQAADAKFRAQLGLTATESKRIGGVAGKLYSQAYGESMDDVRATITAVIRNMDGMRNASSADLQATSARAMDLAAVMGEEVGPVTVAVGQMMKTGLARNSKEAFDVLTVGAQRGANKAEDLLDTFNEYSTQFRDLGLSGAQAMGIIQQGLQGGARDADIVADAMKELNIRVSDMSAAPALKQLGLNAEDMAAAFRKGGPAAASAFDQIMDKLRGVKDRTKQYQLAQQLLGTQSEDMARALAGIDPSEATKKLGKFAGATDAAGKAMGSTFKARLTGFKRTIETQVTNVAGRAMDGLAKFGAEIKKGFKLPPTGKAANDWQRFGQQLKLVADWTRTKLVPALKDMAQWYEKKILPLVMKFYKTVLVELGKQIKRVAGELNKSGIPWGKILKVMQAVYAFAYKYLLKLWGFEFKIALKIAGTWIAYSIKSFGLFWKVLEHGWVVVKRGAKAFQDYYKIVKPAMEGVRRVALQVIGQVLRAFLSFATNLVKGAAKAFGWVPGLGGKLRSAAKNMEKFRRDVNAEIGKITGKKSVNLTVNAKGVWGGAHGPLSPKRPTELFRAKGGPIPATWSGASRERDTVPAMLRVDEHVWTPEEVSDVGGHAAMYRLRAAARKGLLRGYADGGAVSRGVGVTTKVPGLGGTFRPIQSGITSMVIAIAKALFKRFGGATGVVAAARSMIGYPYSWGGGGKGGPSYGIGRGAGTYGFDCSGLAEYAWWKGAHKSIGGVTNSQWAASYPISGPRPGALAFPSGPSVHVMIGSDKPGYVIQAPYTGSFVQEVRRSSGNWRWPKGLYSGGAVGQAGAAALRGPRGMARLAQALGLIGDPTRHRAMGGPVAPGAPYLVGESGAEVFTPRAAGTVHSSKALVIQNLHVNINGRALASKREIADDVLSALRTAKKQGVVVTV